MAQRAWVRSMFCAHELFILLLILQRTTSSCIQAGLDRASEFLTVPNIKALAERFTVLFYSACGDDALQNE